MYINLNYFFIYRYSNFYFFCSWQRWPKTRRRQGQVPKSLSKTPPDPQRVRLAFVRSGRIRKGLQNSTPARTVGAPAVHPGGVRPYLVSKHRQLSFISQQLRETSVSSSTGNCRRQVLQEVVQLSDFTSDKYKEIQRRIETSLEAIKHTEEYKDFTEKHK